MKTCRVVVALLGVALAPLAASTESGCTPSTVAQVVPVAAPTVSTAACVANDVANKVSFWTIVSPAPPMPPDCGEGAVQILDALAQEFTVTHAAPDPYFAQLFTDLQNYHAGKK